MTRAQFAWTAVVALVGCGAPQASSPNVDRGDHRTDPGRGPFGPADESPLLAPFAGKWSYDAKRTTPGQGFTPHPDLNFHGNVAVGTEPGMPNAEYRLFALHAHNGQVCGKAWHHEDRFDPGDMSKCYVRLILKGDQLHFMVKMRDGSVDVDDPEIDGTPLQSPADVCDAEKPPEKDWGDWSTYVFTRAK